MSKKVTRLYGSHIGFFLRETLILFAERMHHEKWQSILYCMKFKNQVWSSAAYTNHLKYKGTS